MKIKHQLALILLCCCAVFAANAQAETESQRTAHLEKMANDLSQTMSSRLQLSNEQHQKLQKINLKYARAMTAARSKTSEGNWAEVEAEIEKITAEHEENLKSVMTNGQLEKWHQILEGEATSRPRKFEDGH